MPCTEAQFEAMRPKLETIEGLEIVDLDDWNEFPFIVNNIYDTSNLVSNLRRKSCTNGRMVYPEFNEQVFLEACGYQTAEAKLDAEISRRLDELSERIARLEGVMTGQVEDAKHEMLKAFVDKWNAENEIADSPVIPNGFIERFLKAL